MNKIRYFAAIISSGVMVTFVDLAPVAGPIEKSRPSVIIIGARSITDHRFVDAFNLTEPAVIVAESRLPDGQTPVSTSLLINGRAEPCMSVAATSDPAPVGERGRTGYIECYFNTTKVLGDCKGHSLSPKYGNGEYELRIQQEMNDDQKLISAPLLVVLNQADAILVEHRAGKSVVRDGHTFFGGPGNSFVGCPIAYSGREYSRLTIRAFLRNLANKRRGATKNPVELKFEREEEFLPTPDSTSAVNVPPAIWTIDRERNSLIENTLNDEYWISVEETPYGGVDEPSPGGAELRTSGMVGPLRFDFVGPTPAARAEIQVNGKAVVKNTHYSIGAVRFRGAVDYGSGIDNDATRISVGACELNPVEVDGVPVDRTAVEFVPLYENVRHVRGLAEEDAYLTSDGYPDEGGVDCYVAELTALVDRLGNTWAGEADPSSWFRTPNFGVDRTPPRFDRIRVNRDGIFDDAADARIHFEVRNRDLSSGDRGTEIAENGFDVYTRPSFRDLHLESSRSSAVIRGTVTFGSQPPSGSYRVAVVGRDSAVPPNRSVASVLVLIDHTPPSFRGLGGTNTLVYATGDTTLIQFRGIVEEALSFPVEATFTVRKNLADRSVCDLSTDPQLRSSRARRIRLRRSSRVEVRDTTIVVRAPAEPSGIEDLCILVEAEDDLRNSASATVTRFAVDWGGTAPPPPPPLPPTTPTASFAVAATTAVENAGTQVVSVNLSPATQSAITLSYTVTGTATSSSDYETLAGSISVSSGESTGNIPVVIIDDDAAEGAETIVLSLRGGTGYTVGSANTHTLTIADNDQTTLVGEVVLSGPLVEDTLTFVETSPADDREDQDPAVLLVSLSRAPLSSVNVQVSARAMGVFSVSTSSDSTATSGSETATLQFEPTNWADTARVLIWGNIDDNIEADRDSIWVAAQGGGVDWTPAAITLQSSDYDFGFLLDPVEVTETQVDTVTVGLFQGAFVEGVPPHGYDEPPVAIYVACDTGLTNLTITHIEENDTQTCADNATLTFYHDFPPALTVSGFAFEIDARNVAIDSDKTIDVSVESDDWFGSQGIPFGGEPGDPISITIRDNG